MKQNIEMVKEKGKSRVEFLKDVFDKDYQRGCKSKKFINPSDQNKYDNIKYSSENSLITDNIPYEHFIDSYFLEFMLSSNNSYPFDITKPLRDSIFEFFLSHDPSPNKEYLNWFLNLYRNLIKHRGSDDISFDMDDKTFFEDFDKITESLEKYSFLKKTKNLNSIQKDITRFNSYKPFLTMIKPYLSPEGDDSVHTLDHQEILAIENHYNFISNNNSFKDKARAEIVFDNKDWIIVITHTKKANEIYGKFTTWCTSSTSSTFGTYFNNYSSKEPLFVLIKKGHGSKKEIEKNPNVRLQFHFQSEQYMNATDSRIDISKFFYENIEIRNFFKDHIINITLPKKQASNELGKQDSKIIEYLLNLGMGDEVINIYKKLRPKEICLQGYKIQSEYLENIGEISSLEVIDLTGCGLTYIPESIKKLKKLQHLKLRKNEGLKELPIWINELNNLKILDIANCDIRKRIKIDGLSLLEELIIDNNKLITQLPEGLGSLKNLRRLTASRCDISKVNEEIMGCDSLKVIDLHDNINLFFVFPEIVKLPKIQLLNFSNVSIPPDVINSMNLIKKSETKIFNYV